MSQIKIADINIDGSELFNDSETFLNELKDSEIDQIVGGLSQELLVDDSTEIKLDDIKLDDRVYVTTVYIPKEPICDYPIYPVKPIEPICYKKPIYYYPCPVIL